MAAPRQIGTRWTFKASNPVVGSFGMGVYSRILQCLRSHSVAPGAVDPISSPPISGGSAVVARPVRRSSASPCHPRRRLVSRGHRRRRSRQPRHRPHVLRLLDRQSRTRSYSTAPLAATATGSRRNWPVSRDVARPAGESSRSRCRRRLRQRVIEDPSRRPGVECRALPRWLPRQPPARHRRGPLPPGRSRPHRPRRDRPRAPTDGRSAG